MRTLGRNAGYAGLLCGVVLFQVALTAVQAQGAEPGGGAAAAPVGEVAKDAATTDALKDSGPFGGCEPIGMTASGELVFPLDCKKVIKKPAAAPVAEDKPPGDDKTASTDAKPNPPSQAAVDDTPAAAETKAAGEATAQAPATPPESKHPATSDKVGPAQKAAADPVAGSKLATGKAAASASKSATSKAASSKAMPDEPGAGHLTPGTMPPGRAASGRTAAATKDPSVKGGQPAAPKGAREDRGKEAKAGEKGKEASKRTTASDKKPLIVMAKPAAVTTPVAARPQAEETPRLRTAGMPACVQFRSYNPTTRSYRGFDGHVYECK